MTSTRDAGGGGAGRDAPVAHVATAGLVAVAALAYALCDVLHELAHALAATGPFGVRALSVSTIGLASVGSSPWVAVAGPAANLVLGCALLAASARTLPPATRHFAWLFGTLNLFDATAYLVYSAAFDGGDWAVVLRALAPDGWRPAAAVAGIVTWAASIALSMRVLRGLCASGVVAARDIERCCVVPYWSGALLLTLGAAFNPAGPAYILTSGAATGFGAMAGLLLIPVLLRRRLPADRGGTLVIGPRWLAAGVLAALLFVGVFGPGVPLAGT